MKYHIYTLHLFFFTLILLGLGINPLQAQVTINNTDADPDPSAMLDISSIDKGLLMPRLTTNERDSINSPATGLLVFDTDENSFFYYNGTTWERLGNSYYSYDNNQDDNTECEKILAADGAEGDQFGFRMDTWSNYLIIGATVNNNTIGAAYIFEYSAGSWIQKAKLTASDGVDGDLLGYGVAITENYAFACAPGKNNQQGSIYIFERSGDTWTEVQQLEALDGESGDILGYSLAASDDYFVVTAPTVDDNTGAAYVFQNLEAGWVQQTKLVASNRTSDAYFGFSVALSDDFVVIGTPGAEQDGNDLGGVYFFQETQGIWIEQHSIFGPYDGHQLYNFGHSVTFFNDLLLVSFPINESVHAYEYDGTNWTEIAELQPDPDNQNLFGFSIDASTTQIIVGAPIASISGVTSGAAYIYNYSNGEWTLDAQVISSTPHNNQLIGYATGFVNDIPIAAAPTHIENDLDVGAVFTYCKYYNTYLDNTDNQELSLDGNDLSIENGNSVNLNNLDTDNQKIDLFALSDNMLQVSIEDDGQEPQEVDLSPLLDNTDDQMLTMVNDSLVLENGDSIDLSSFKDLSLFNISSTFNTYEQWLSGDGDDEGINITTDGNINITSASTDAVLRLTPPTATDNAQFSFKDELNNTLWNMGSNPSSGIFTLGDGVNTPFQIEQGAASNTLVLAANGSVGISPSSVGPINGKFEVNGHVSPVINNYTYLSNNSAFTEHISDNTSPKDISIYANERIVGKFVISMSDARIKDIQGISNSAKDFDLLRQIQITDYQFKDQLKEGQTQQKKVIAQQVAEVFPQAVNKQFTEVVPDIYQKATMDEKGWIDLATDLKVGEKVQIIFEDRRGILEVLQVSNEAFQVMPSTTDLPLSTVFVYGRQVHDFHTVDYDAISMLNVSATQELAKRMETLKAAFEMQQTEIKVLEEGMNKVEELEAIWEDLQGQSFDNQ